MDWYDAIKIPICVGICASMACVLAHDFIPLMSIAIVWDVIAVIIFVRLCKYTDAYPFNRVRHIAFAALCGTAVLMNFFIKPGAGILQLFGIVLLFFVEFYVVSIGIFLDK